MSKPQLKVFISYAHNDQIYFDVFVHELAEAVGASPNFNWDIWEDHSLKLGEKWHEQIQQRIEEADAAIFLVSNGFLASDYIKRAEFDVLIERQTSDKILFFPILFKPCHFTNWPELSEIQVFQPEGRSYKEPAIPHISFADLVELGEQNVPKPNPMRTRYLNDFVNSVEEAILASNIKSAPAGDDNSDDIVKVAQGRVYLDPDIYKHTCDRIPHCDRFAESEKSAKKVQFFCIHGREEQSPFGLSKRFHYHLTRQLDDFAVTSNPANLHGICEEIDFTDSTKEPQFKSNLIQRVFSYFRVESEKYAPPIESNLGVIVQNSPLLKSKTQDDIVSIYLRIIREEWRDFIPAVLQWFIDEFCAEAVLPATSPRFYFFVSLIYEEEHNKKDREKMLAAIEAVSNMIALPELTAVHKKLIIEWMREHKAASTTLERKALFTKYFKENDSYDMEIVETQLDELIRKEIVEIE